MPTELDDIRRKVMQLEIEEAALKKETDSLSKERLEAIGRELAQVRDEFKNKLATWENEKASVDKLSKLREDIESGLISYQGKRN